MRDKAAMQNAASAQIRETANKTGGIKLSIIVISYNEAEYLPEALESCLNQRGLENFEIIIGDDGSSDSSLEVIQSYAAQWPDTIRYYVNSRADGVTIAPIRVSNSIKKAMAMARGKYLAILSGDDRFCDPERFSTDIAFLDAHSRYIACCSDFKMFHDDGTEQLYAWYGFSPSFSWSGAYVHISCFTFRRKVYQEGLLQYFCDDCGLVYSIGCCGDWCYRHKTTFAYRQRTQSIMHDANQLELIMIELLLLQDVLQNGRRQRAATWAHFARPLVSAFFQREHLKDSSRSMEYLQFSARQTPDLLNTMAEFDERPLVQKILCLALLLWACCCNRIYGVLRKIIMNICK